MPTTLTLGRDPSTDLTLADGSVSRRHAELVLLDDRRIFVRDLTTANGTTRIRQGTRTRIERDVIAPGDEVAFGDVVLSFDTLRGMLLEKLGRAPATPVAGHGYAGPAQDGGAAAGAAHGGAAHGAPGYRAPGHANPGYGSPGYGGAAPAGPAHGGAAAHAHDDPARQPGVLDFVPLIGGVSLMRERGLLLPGLAFAILVCRLMYLRANRSADPEYLARFIVEFSVVLVLAALVVVYRLCGKYKPLLVIVGVMGAEALVMSLHPVLMLPFCDATGALGILDTYKKSFGDPNLVAPGTLSVFWAFFTCAGLLEEMEKMLPVFGLIWFASSSTRTDAKRWGVFEPLDAIVYACAAAATFIIIETFGETGYVGASLEKGRELNNLANQALNAFPLAIVRTIDALTGHLAYSGYFAYFVGLGLLRPTQRERLWIGGWISAALIHATFNTFAANTFMSTVATFLGFFFLLTAILHARRVSPTRDENFATRAVPKAKLSTP